MAKLVRANKETAATGVPAEINRLAKKYLGIADQDGWETLELTLKHAIKDKKKASAVMKEIERLQKPKKSNEFSHFETAANEEADLLALVTRVLGVKLRKSLPDLYAGFSVQRPTQGKVLALASNLNNAGYESDTKSFVSSSAASSEGKTRIGFNRIDSRVSDMSRATIGIDMTSGVVTVKIMS